MEKNIAKSTWLPAETLLATELSGDVSLAEVEKWERSLLNAINGIEAGGTFKIFVNLYGFKAANIEVHKRFRNVIPLTLARYGWKVGYLQLFEEAKNLQTTNERGIRCVGAVHVHHDAEKIGKYQSLFGTATEQFSTDPAWAMEWIRNL